MSKILAGYVLAVAAAHEAAYNKAGADAATDEYLKGGDRTEVGAQMFVDYAQFQTKTIYQCAEEVVPHLYRQPVYLLLQTAWNDALMWANDTMALRDADGDDTHNFRLGIETPNGTVDYQLSAQNELCAAFKLGQIFHQDLSIETVKLL
jgi:hypothetical protein